MYKQSIDLNAKNVLGDYVYSDEFLDKARRDAYKRATNSLINYGYDPVTREGTAEALAAMEKYPSDLKEYNRNMNVVDKATNTIFSRKKYPTGTDINSLYPSNARFMDILTENRLSRMRPGSRLLPGILGVKSPISFLFHQPIMYPDANYRTDSKYEYILDKARSYDSSTGKLLTNSDHYYRRKWPEYMPQYNESGFLMYKHDPKDVQGTMRNIANQFASGNVVHSPEWLSGNRSINSVLRKKLLDAYKGAKNTVFTRPWNYMSDLLKKLKGIRL